MKLLIAVEGKGKKTLVWAGRTGYAVRQFLHAATDLDLAREALEDLNYEHYLDLKPNILVIGERVHAYAINNGYDLVLCLPPDLIGWNRKRDKDQRLLDFIEDVGTARKALADDPNKKFYPMANDTKMVRV